MMYIDYWYNIQKGGGKGECAMEERPGNSLFHSMLGLQHRQLDSWVGGQVVGTRWTTQSDNTGKLHGQSWISM